VLCNYLNNNLYNNAANGDLNGNLNGNLNGDLNGNLNTFDNGAATTETIANQPFSDSNSFDLESSSMKNIVTSIFTVILFSVLNALNY